MLTNGIDVKELRDLGAQPLAARELDQLMGARDYRDFLNPRNELFRSQGMKTKPPARKEALMLMAKNPSLVRRPILVVDGKVAALGWDEATWKEILT